MNWHDYFTYDAKAGDLIWKALSEDLFRKPADATSWNTRYAGTITAGKYLTKFKLNAVVQFSKKLKNRPPLAYKHRVIYEMHHGAIPAGMLVDHKDRDPLNNRLDNLRLATKAQNGSNSRVPRNNTSGYRGVHRSKRDGTWRAAIRVNGRCIHIGSFSCPKAASDAYAAAQAKYHGEFAGAVMAESK